MPNLVSLIFFVFTNTAISAFFKIINQYTDETQKKMGEGLNPNHPMNGGIYFYLIDCVQVYLRIGGPQNKYSNKAT